MCVKCGLIKMNFGRFKKHVYAKEQNSYYRNILYVFKVINVLQNFDSDRIKSIHSKFYGNSPIYLNTGFTQCWSICQKLQSLLVNTDIMFQWNVNRWKYKSSHTQDCVNHARCTWEDSHQERMWYVLHLCWTYACDSAR